MQIDNILALQASDSDPAGRGGFIPPTMPGTLAPGDARV